MNPFGTNGDFLCYNFVWLLFGKKSLRFLRNFLDKGFCGRRIRIRSQNFDIQNGGYKMPIKLTVLERDFLTEIRNQDFFFYSVLILEMISKPNLKLENARSKTADSIWWIKIFKNLSIYRKLNFLRFFKSLKSNLSAKFANLKLRIQYETPNYKKKLQSALKSVFESF